MDADPEVVGAVVHVWEVPADQRRSHRCARRYCRQGGVVHYEFRFNQMHPRRFSCHEHVSELLADAFEEAKK